MVECLKLGKLGNAMIRYLDVEYRLGALCSI